MVFLVLYSWSSISEFTICDFFSYLVARRIRKRPVQRPCGTPTSFKVLALSLRTLPLILRLRVFSFGNLGFGVFGLGSAFGIWWPAASETAYDERAAHPLAPKKSCRHQQTKSHAFACSTFFSAATNEAALFWHPSTTALDYCSRIVSRPFSTTAANL